MGGSPGHAGTNTAQLLQPVSPLPVAQPWVGSEEDPLACVRPKKFSLFELLQVQHRDMLTLRVFYF